MMPLSRPRECEDGYKVTPSNDSASARPSDRFGIGCACVFHNFLVETKIHQPAGGEAASDWNNYSFLFRISKCRLFLHDSFKKVWSYHEVV